VSSTHNQQSRQHAANTDTASLNNPLYPGSGRAQDKGQIASTARPDAQRKLRVAMFVEQFPVLSETFILNQITGLLDQGHEVDIYARHYRRQTEVHCQIAEYQLLQRLIVVAALTGGLFSRIKQTLAIVTADGAWKKRGFLGLITKICSHKRRSPSLTLLALLQIGCRQLTRGRYDVVHCQYGTQGLRVLTLKQSGIAHGKYLTSFRGHDATQHLRIKPGLYNELFELGDLFLPVSDHLMQRILDLGCDPKKVRVLHSGIQCRHLPFLQRHLPEQGPVRIATVARLVEMKGVEYAIRAVAKLIARGYQVEYHIAGDGPLRDHLQALAKQLCVADAVRFPGWQSHKQVLQLLDQAQILMAPSVTAANGETEGNPNIVKEAMALGLPVVSTAHAGIPELVDDGRSGLLVPERDAAALADKTSWLLDNPDRWPALTLSARSKVLAEFDADTLNQQLIALYQTP
jgi:colanic acid/amylovoran biosynthesis glycosyltransferase